MIPIHLHALFITPLSTPHTREKLQDDILELIKKDISKYSNDGKIILAGDLNARTGTHALDFIPADNTIKNIPIFENKFTRY
jgi:endonuclease/exonuclease/phosphatase (EEP) superfamily protein YafD